MKYELVKKEYVIETLAKGNDVILCDFSTMKMVSCGSLTVNAIVSYIEKDTTVFYKVVPNE